MMQASYYKKLLSFSVPVVAMLAVSIPESAYPGGGLSSARSAIGSKGKGSSVRSGSNITRNSGLGTSKRRSAYSNIGRNSAPASRSVSTPRARSTGVKNNYSGATSTRPTGYSVNQASRRQLADIGPSVPANRSNSVPRYRGSSKAVKQNYSAGQKTSPSAHSVNIVTRKQLADVSPPVPANKSYAAKQHRRSSRNSVNSIPRAQLATINPKQNYINEKVIKKPVPVTTKKHTTSSTKHKKHHGHHGHKKHHGHHGHKKHHGHSFSSVFFSFGGYYPYHYYPYSYYSGYYDYNYPFYEPYGYTTDYGYDYYEPPVYSTSKDYMGSPGWDLLAQRNYEDAINVFLKDIQISEDDGIPKVGLALATAADGNLTTAIQYMRDAFRFDPNSTKYLYYDVEVITIINELIEKYEYRFQTGNNIDDIFMVSALYYLKFDYDNAHDALNRASILGDRGPSIGNLHGLIDDQLSSQYAGQQ